MRDRLALARIEADEARERTGELERLVLEIAEREAEQLRRELAERDLRDEETRKQIQQLEAQRADDAERLRLEEERVGHLDRELAAGLDRQEELQQEVAGLEKRLATLRSGFEDAKRRAGALEEELAHNAEEAAALRDGLATATQRAAKLKAEVARHEGDAKRAEAERDALQSSLDQVRAVLGNLPDGVVSAEVPPPEPEVPETPGPGPVIREVDTNPPRALIRPDGRFLELNAAFSALLGYDETELSKVVWPPTSDRKRLPQLREITRRVLEGKSREARVETQYLTAEGTKTRVKGTLRLVRNDEGGPDHLELKLDAA